MIVEIKLSELSKIPPISLKKITLSGRISLANAKVALSPLILTFCPSFVDPIGAITGMPPFKIISFIFFECVLVTSPTNPNSLFLILHSNISFTNGIAAIPMLFSAEVILLFSSLKIDIAISRTSLEVTL